MLDHQTLSLCGAQKPDPEVRPGEYRLWNTFHAGLREGLIVAVTLAQREHGRQGPALALDRRVPTRERDVWRLKGPAGGGMLVRHPVQRLGFCIVVHLPSPLRDAEFTGGRVVLLYLQLEMPIHRSGIPGDAKVLRASTADAGDSK